MNAVKQEFDKIIKDTLSWIERVERIHASTPGQIDKVIETLYKLNKEFTEMNIRYSRNLKDIVEYKATIDKHYYKFVDYKTSPLVNSEIEDQIIELKNELLSTLNRFVETIKIDYMGRIGSMEETLEINIIKKDDN